MKRQRRQPVSKFSDDEISLAFRQRIQLLALNHRIGKSAPGHVAMRFRKAGTWVGEITQQHHDTLFPVLSQSDHPLRMPLPVGPLVVVVEDNTRGIIDVSDHLLSHDFRVRLAALNHFLSAQSNEECWVSPYVLDLLQRKAEALSCKDEPTWIEAGLALRDAIDRDFRVNCAGVHQASCLQYDESYQKYLSKVIRPRAHSFERDRPSVWSPTEEVEMLRTKLEEWSSIDELAIALNRYLEFCGYLPLAGELSAGSLIAAWERRHSGHDIWSTVWKWTESCPSVLAQYHAAHAFLEQPRWIRLDENERLLNVIRGAITSSEPDSSYSHAPLWKLRSLLLQHYQLHLEAAIPGLKGDVVAAAACWMAEMVARLFDPDPEHVKNGCDFLRTETLPWSWRRWFMARSRMAPSALRLANLNAPCIWGDALLSTAVRRFVDFPECAAKDAYRTFLITQLNSAISVGSLRVGVEKTAAYAFEQPVSASNLELTDNQTEDQFIDSARQVVSARCMIEEEDRTMELLTELRVLRDGPAIFVCNNLRCLLIHCGHVDSPVRDLLNDTDWRQKVFQELQLDALEKLILFLTEWQLQQDEDWLIRLPQLFAIECDNAKEPERRRLLFAATSYSAMAADVASPIVRLLVGPKRTELTGLFDDWRQTTREIARESEPWLAARIRGFLGTIENLI